MNRMNPGEKTLKDKIISAAWELFREKGFNHTTIDDIINKSGVSKGSFYYHFNKKDDLLDTLALVLDDYYEEMEKEIPAETNSIEKLLILNYKAHAMIEKDISLEILASLYSTQLLAQGQGSLLNRNRKYYTLVNKIVEEGQTNGEITVELTCNEITKYYAVCERALVYDWCLSKGEYSLAEYSRKMMPYMIGKLKA